MALEFHFSLDAEYQLGLLCEYRKEARLVMEALDLDNCSSGHGPFSRTDDCKFRWFLGIGVHANYELVASFRHGLRHYILV